MSRLLCARFAFLCASALIWLTPGRGRADDASPTASPVAGYLAVEVLSPFTGGFDGELGFALGANRFSMEFRKLELPGLYNSQKDDFKVTYGLVGVSYQRFLLWPLDGLYVGATLDYNSDVQVERKNTLLAGHKSYFTLSARVGYLWVPFTGLGLYVEPAFQIGVALNDKDITLAGLTYAKKALQMAGPIIHLGWRLP